MGNYSKNQERVLLNLFTLGPNRMFTATRLHDEAGFGGRPNATGAALKGLYKRGLVDLFLTSPRSYSLTAAGKAEVVKILKELSDASRD